MKKRAVVLDLDEDGEADHAALFPDYQMIEIFHEPAAYFARLTKSREDKQDARDTIGPLHQAAA